VRARARGHQRGEGLVLIVAGRRRHGEPGARGGVQVRDDEPRVHGLQPGLEKRVHRRLAEDVERSEARVEHLLRAVLEADGAQERDDLRLSRAARARSPRGALEVADDESGVYRPHVALEQLMVVCGP